MDPNSTSEDVKFTPDPYQVPFVQAFDQATRVYQDLGGPSQAPLPCVLWPVLPEPLPQGQLTAYHVSTAPTGSWFSAPQPAPENAYQAYAAPQLFPVSDITQNQQTNQAGEKHLNLETILLFKQQQQWCLLAPGLTKDNS